MSDDRLNDVFKEMSTFAREHSNGYPGRDLALSFGGETPGQAIEGLAEWSAANEQSDCPFRIDSIRLKENFGSIPAFSVIITLDDVR